MSEPTLMMQVIRETILGLQEAAPDGDLKRLTFCCAGIVECHERVETRGAVCERCLAEAPRHRRVTRIATTRERLSPGGVLDFCLPGNETYQQTTRLARDAARALEPEKRKDALAVIEHAAWKRSNGGMLLLGPTGIGKSKVLVAIGLRILREAEANPDLDEASFRFATGIEYVSGVRMARAAREQRLGEIDRIFQAAEHATLLLFDEIGYEDGRIDPFLVRDLLRARYEPKFRPTIVASGETLDQLNVRYGEAAVRTIWARGRLVDLHPADANLG